MGRLGVNRLEQREERGEEAGDGGEGQILLVVILTHPVHTLGNDPFMLSQHLAWCTHTITKGYMC